MLTVIKHLEKESLALEPDESQRTELTQKITSYIHRFITNLPTDAAFEEDTKAAEMLDTFFPMEEGRSDEEVMKVIDQSLIKPGINMASGSDLAYIPGGGLYVSALADYIGAATDKYAGVYNASPGATRMENMLVRWLCDLVGYGDKSFGHLSSGGSMANLTAIVAARDAMNLLHQPGKKVIYFTHQVHHCLLKALHISGLNACRIRLVPMKESLQMNVSALKQFIEEDKKEGLIPALVVASAGTTDVGAIDELDKIADVAKENHMWYHIDGAYGGFFLLTDYGKKMMKGISRADSVVMDPHKGLFLPYGSGAVLLKNGHYLFNSFYQEANYLQDAQIPEEQLPDYMETSPSDISPELSRHFRGLRMWLPLQLHGLKPFRAALNEKLLLTRYFHKEIKKAGFETGAEPQLSVTIFRYVPSGAQDDLKAVNLYNRNLMHRIQNEKKVFIASTTIDGVYWLRLAVLSFRTHLSHIETLLNSLRRNVLEM